MGKKDGHKHHHDHVQVIKHSSRKLLKYDDENSQDDDQSYRQTTMAAELNYVNTKGETVSNKPNPRFKNYSYIFKNLVKSNNVTTMYDI